MVRLCVALASVVILIVPTSGGAEATEPARLSFALGVTPTLNYYGPFVGSGLCLADADGDEGSRLTPPRAYDDSPSWSPDGRMLAFHRVETSQQEAHHWIYVRDERGRLQAVAEGVHRFPWNFGGVGNPDWSPDGQRIVYASWGGYRGSVSSTIVTARADGSDRRTLISSLFSGFLSDPQWSPSGNSIVYERGTDLFLIDADGGEERLIVANGSDPAWSPDGRSIVFSGLIGGPNYSDLVIIGADGHDQRRLTDDQGEEESPTWSPDGDWIAFEKRDHCASRCGGSLDGTDIAVVRPDGSDEHFFRASSFAELTPAWRPSAPKLPGTQRPCVYRGSRGPNTIRGSGLGDVIVTGRGRDVIYARGGNDIVNPGRGRDLIRGGSGSDIGYLDGYDRQRGIEIVYPPRP